MSKIKVTVQQHYFGHYTVTDDNYDGAPDANPNCEGEGHTPEAALEDYYQNARDFYFKEETK